jgi:septum formation topological specificity factor MinE
MGFLDRFFRRETPRKSAKERLSWFLSTTGPTFLPARWS